MQIQVNGVSLHYRFDGPEDAPLITMSHSLATDLTMWAWQMPVLSSFRVLRFDTRGHGQSEAPAGAYTLDQLADDLFALLDALEIEKTHFVGLSMGGMIAQTAALRDQSRFSSLALCDTSSAISKDMQPLWQERIDTARSKGMGLLVQPTIDRWFSASFQLSNASEVDKIREMIANTPVDGFCGCCHAISKLSLTDRLNLIKTPTLLIVGENDTGTPVAAHETIRDQIDDSKLVVLPEALHLSNVERQSDFNQTLIDFLQTQPG